MLTSEMQAVEFILGCVISNRKFSFFGGAVRDVLMGITPQDLDVFIQVPTPILEATSQIIGKILLKAGSFSMNKEVENVTAYSSNSSAGFSRYPVVINGVKVDLIFSNADIDEDWGRRPDADVNLLYTPSLSSIITGEATLGVMKNSIGATLPSILDNAWNKRCVFEQGVTQKRLDKMDNKGWKFTHK